MGVNLRAVAAFARAAETEDLLDRVTVYRHEMEPAALDLIEHELARRNVTPEQIAAHAGERRAAGLFAPDGTAVRCEHCDRPAVVREWGWHRLAGRLPVFPRRVAYCADHAPPDRAAQRATDEADEG